MVTVNVLSTRLLHRHFYKLSRVSVILHNVVE